MELPLLLAGPILRRVDPTLAAVWLALSKQATVTLRVWEGQLTSRAAGETAAPFVQSNAELTWRLGEELHLVVLSARIPPQAGKSFQADTTYCYDLSIEVDNVDKPFTLKTLGMLDAAKPEDAQDGIEHVALGYEPDLLPSFAPPPSELTDLHVIYGSCRRPAHQDPDAMVWIDDHLLEQRRYKDPRARPHQLFLGGDQIYADNVHILHMLMLMDLGQQLIGREPQPPHGPLEQIDTGRTVGLRQPVTTLPPIPRKAYEGTDEDIARQPLPPQTRLPADRDHFPEGQRKDLTLRSAQFTSTDGSSHLISAGEFAAMYLSVWSNAVWPREIPLARLQPDPADPFTLPLTWTSQVTSVMTIQLPELVAAEKVPLHLYRLPETDEEKRSKTPDEIKKEQRKEQRSLRHHLGVHRDFLAGLARVRRVLANIPTYMILDDHDVTDDFFLNPVWRDRVLTTNLGQTILRNAMLTYALFQDWGNNPVRYDSGYRAELVTLATSLFPPGQPGPRPSACDRLDELFGHDLRNELNEAGQYDGVNPPITWHFTIDGPKHRAVALDNRTRRSYVSDLGPPGNVSPLAQDDQIPELPLPAGLEVLIVIAPLQVIGPPILDDLLAPNIYRATDFISGFFDKDSPLNPVSPTGMRGMTGTDPDAIEAWAIDAVTFEHLLRKLAGFRQVVLLSGDVHNSSGTEMSYWRKDDVDPARIIQFTSSGFKNVMPAEINAVDRAAGFAQQLIRAGFGTERIGWLRAEDDLVLLPDGATPFDVALSTRKRLRTEPVMIPTWGWPNDPPPPNGEPQDPRSTSRLNPDRPPDWRWRTKPLLDLRPDLERPEPIRPRVLDDGEIDQLLSSDGTKVQAYQKIAARHQSSLGRLRNARQIMFRSNFGLLRFEREQDDTLTAVHEVYTAYTDPEDPNPPARPTPAPYLLQRASLRPPHEEAPGRLRTKVLETPAKEGDG